MLRSPVSVVRAIQQEILSGNLGAVLTRYSDLLLVACIALVIGMMIVPLPTWLLDVFLTLNITAAVTILMVSIYISQATQIVSYPTLLLITTLYRLALDISATRLILLQADAGEVIQAFGMFVVGGDFVVGAVIFLIITLVQFIVITKGAERVAEVSARFTLDAMPGKQMSIDADMRAGLIDIQQARTRREALARESQFFLRCNGWRHEVRQGRRDRWHRHHSRQHRRRSRHRRRPERHGRHDRGPDLFHSDDRQRSGLANSRAAYLDLGWHGSDARRFR
jgi:type III secretion protein V